MTLLDTDVCIEILHKNEIVLRKRKQENDTVAISFMTAAELYYGAAKSSHIEHNYEIIERFLLTINIIHSDARIVQTYGELKAQLEEAGVPLADADLFIASTALEKCEKLVTGNSKHYSRIDQLRIEDWMR
jgi:tRNA(fMet)-specific endonuclease VapC